MDIQALIRNVVVKVGVASVCLLVLPSCSNNWLYEEEGDCSVYYRLKFRYDRNLKWADAFANEVSSVHLYAFDTSGILTWQREEQIDPFTAENYSISLDLPAGDYRLLAWCGLRNDGGHEESFSVPEARVGETRMEQLQCALNRQHDESGAYSKERLYRLFHGTLDVSLPSNDDGGSYDYTMYLTKNTNHIRIILHHLSGEDVDVNQFTFRIEDENGLMAHDNELLEDENITYRPWKMQNGEAGLGKADSRAIIHVKGAIADLTVGRMMETHREKMFLTITNREGGIVARIPVIDHVLLAKDYYEEEYNRTMTDQEFLDREDDYVMTFFLDENNKWISSYILIQSWRVVLSNVEVE
ncbi:FimB/Mfa2 family fimbrial subunit [uncultured Sanguibacteroides sp.]|uniref:FimB/Mfa2 family fimbrial subunit n=1 Tax=uncultured Sanguibacteroides sp. TaxID=1635151 RepID=UPI0025F9B2EF|nr:FimB/Mfa2 family fimbrial subunit [uncultured Sanguibacteroides sp.]